MAGLLFRLIPKEEFTLMRVLNLKADQTFCRGWL
jgi:hypothetical protein